MAGRFAGKYDILDREVKLGMQTLSAVETATGRHVSIFCLPLSVLQIDLPCPPEFIENRFRSAVTIEGDVLEADVDPETECAYLVVSDARSKAQDATKAPTVEFRAWPDSSAGAEGVAEAATAERPAWRTNPPISQSAEPSAPQPVANSQPASEGGVSFTQLFSGPPAGKPASSDFGRQPPNPIESREAPAQQNESFTAVFKAAAPASVAPPTPETPLTPSSSPLPGEAETPSGGFRAFFGIQKSSSTSPSAFAAPEESPLSEPAQPAVGSFTAMFGGAPPSRAVEPEVKLAPQAPPDQAPGTFTAMFSKTPASPAANAFPVEPPRKAPGAFTELFQNTPEPSFAPSSVPTPDLNSGVPPSSPPPASSAKPGGFTDIFGARPNEPRPAPAPPPAAPGSAPQVDLTPRFDRPNSATQYGAQPAATPSVQSEVAAPTPRSGPSQYTVVRKGWSAPPPPSDPMAAAPNLPAPNLPQAPAAIPAPQWPPAAAPAPPSVPQVPVAPQMPMAQPAVPQYQAPAWPPQAMPPQPPAMPAMPATPAAPAPASQAPPKSKPSYLPLIIIFNALFVLAVIIVLIFVFTKH